MTVSRYDLLRWLYLGRMTVVTGVFSGALFSWFAGADDIQRFIASVAFLITLVATGASYWHSHGKGGETGVNFMYVQVLLDVVLATLIIDITGGAESTFTPLYILVIAEGALLLPLPGGVLIGGLASSLYIADIFWFQAWFRSAAEINSVLFQVVLFTLVALATGLLGDRLRRAGIALGEVESELRQLRLDTGDILANVASGVLTVDGRGRLAYLNPAGERLLGLSAQEWLGTPVVSKVEEIAPGLGKLLRRSIDEEVPVRRYKTKAQLDGHELILGVSTAVLKREGGGPPSATAIFRDITELERIATLNRQTERLEAVAELAASLAHEIKNPLASIRSAVEQIAKAHLPAGDREVLARLVLTESDRLSRLLTEFLEFSGMQMGRRESLDFAEVVRHCISLARQQPECVEGGKVSGSGLEGPFLIPGDRDLLHRAVFNIVLNAVQFSGPGGEVTVTLDRAPKDLPQAVEEMLAPVRLGIRDSGPGVSPGEVDRIFNPFYTTRDGGSGLGLAVVHRAIQAHEGLVLVGSSSDRGAEFVIYLPGALAPSDTTAVTTKTVATSGPAVAEVTA